MAYIRYRLIARFSRYGVLHREEVKNDLAAVTRLVQHGWLRKVRRDRKVFYELTDKSVPLLEARRKALREEIEILAALHKPPSIFHALLEDVRFLDDTHRSANHFRFLGDWQLGREVVPSQLQLAKLRYYEERAWSK
jgi:DNA-binding transcriptional regulator PaaX